MKFKHFLLMLLIGVVILFFAILLIKYLVQNVKETQQTYDKYFSKEEDSIPQIPRTDEIPIEIRQKFAAVPEKPVLIAEIEQGDRVESVKFSPSNPNLVVSIGRDKNFKSKVKLWNIDKPITPLAEFSGNTASFSPDGKILAISDLDDFRAGVKLWNIADVSLISSIRLTGFEIVYSPNGNHLAVKTKGLELWDVSNPTNPVEAFKLKTKNFQEDHTFSIDGKLIATIESRTDIVNIWEVNGNHVNKKNSINVIDEKVGWIEAMQFLPDPKNPILAIADNDEDIRLYYPPDWQNYNTIHAGNVYDIAFTPDGKTIISGGGNEIEFWSVENGNRITSIEGYSSWVNYVDVSADGKFVAAGGNDGVIRIWDITHFLPTRQSVIPNVVVPIYFLPTNRLPQTDIPEEIDKILKDVQTYFADEMERHGHGRKSFNYLKNSDGSAKVYLIEGKTTDEYYNNTSFSRVKKEIRQHFDSMHKLLLVVVESRREINPEIVIRALTEIDNIEEMESVIFRIESKLQDLRYSLRNIVFRQTEDEVILRTTLNRYSKFDIASKFADSFGLNRDYRNPSYLMSNSDQSKHVSNSSAAWLNKSKFFNNLNEFSDEQTIIEELPRSKEKARFEVEDADGIFQVRLLVTPTNENPPPSFQWKSDPVQNQSVWEKQFMGRYEALHDFKLLNGEKKVTVELNYPKFTEDMVEIHVLDGLGNRVYKYLDLNGKRGNSFGYLLRQIFN